MRDVSSEEVDGGLIARITVDRVTAGRLGVTMQADQRCLSNAFGQRQVSTIYEQANQYRVVLEAAPEYRSDPSRLNRLYVPSSTTGTQVLLTSVASMTYRDGAARDQSSRPIPGDDHQLQSCAERIAQRRLAAIETAKKTIELPATVNGTFYGDAAEFSKSLQGSPGSFSLRSSRSTSCSAFSTKASSIRSRF